MTWVCYLRIIEYYIKMNDKFEWIDTLQWTNVIRDRTEVQQLHEGRKYLKSSNLWQNRIDFHKISYKVTMYFILYNMCSIYQYTTYYTNILSLYIM